MFYLLRSELNDVPVSGVDSQRAFAAYRSGMMQMKCSTAVDSCWPSSRQKSRFNPIFEHKQRLVRLQHQKCGGPSAPTTVDYMAVTAGSVATKFPHRPALPTFRDT